MAPLPMEARTTTGRFLASHPKQIVRAVAFTAGILAAACSQAASNAPVPAHLLGIAPAPDRERHSILYSLGSGYQGLMPQAGPPTTARSTARRLLAATSGGTSLPSAQPAPHKFSTHSLLKGTLNIPWPGCWRDAANSSEPALEKNVCCIAFKATPTVGSRVGVSISQRQTLRDDAWRRIKRGRSRF